MDDSFIYTIDKMIHKDSDDFKSKFGRQRQSKVRQMMVYFEGVGKDDSFIYTIDKMIHKDSDDFKSKFGRQSKVRQRDG